MAFVSQKFGGGAYLSNTTGNFSSIGNGAGLASMFSTNLYARGSLSYWYNSSTPHDAAIFTIRTNSVGGSWSTTTQYAILLQTFHHQNGTLEVVIGNGNWDQASKTINRARLVSSSSVIKFDGTWHNICMSWDMSVAATDIKYLTVFCDSLLPSAMTIQGNTSRLVTATIANGGNGYGANQTFPVLINGGTYSVQATVIVTTNGSGVVTLVNSIPEAGTYTVIPTQQSNNQPVGGSGTGLVLNCNFTEISRYIPDGTNGVRYLTPGTFFLVGGELVNPYNSQIATFPYNGMLAEVWFNPSATQYGLSDAGRSITGISKTATSTAGADSQSIGASLLYHASEMQMGVADHNQATTVYAGKVSKEGTALRVTYPNGSSVPPVYLSARDGKLFQDNHSGTSTFKVNKPANGIYQTGTSEPPFF